MNRNDARKAHKKRNLNATRPVNAAELLASLGDVPPERVRLWPPPGTATINDLIQINDSGHSQICELIDGTLVEKPMGFSESQAANHLIGKVQLWNEDIRLGFDAGEAGIVQLTPGQGRGPDFAFYLYERFPNRKRPKGQVPLMYPDFAVEILSPSNTRKEMERKRREYFAAGTRLVWEVDLKKRIVKVYRDPETCKVYRDGDTLTGDDVLPGFKISIRKWLDSVTPE